MGQGLQQRARERRLAPIRTATGLRGKRRFCTSASGSVGVCPAAGRGLRLLRNRNGRVAKQTQPENNNKYCNGKPHSSTGVLARSFHIGKRLMVEDFTVSAAIRSAAKIPRIRARALLSTEATCCFCAAVNICQSGSCCQRLTMLSSR